MLCSYSSKLSLDGYTVIDNKFLNEFLPQATGDDVKVFLFGLGLCSNPNTEENNLDTISRVLSITEQQVIASFKYWQEVGLLQIVSDNPFEVKYLPVRSNSGSMKLRNKEKYADFNKQMQQVITERMITPVEFNEYYSLIEVYHFEPEAVVLIAKYCTTFKSRAIGYPYILAVARSFAAEGLKTYAAVEAKFLEQEQNSKEIKQVLSALGIRREADLDERNQYVKWLQNYGYAQGTIVQVAKTLGKRGGMAKLDEVLTKCYEQKLITFEEIEHSFSERNNMLAIAQKVATNLGLYYQSYEAVVDTYVVDWVNKGYDADTLSLLSTYCLRQNVRTFEGFDTTIQKLYKLGLVSLASIEQYISGVLETDSKVKEVLDKLGLLRGTTSYDRDCYRMWTENWGFTQPQILMVAQACKGKASPMPYINKVLANFHDEGITSDDKIKEKLQNFDKNNEKIANNKDFSDVRSYSKEQLSAVFDSLDDIEI